MALGADRRRVVRLVVGEAGLLAVIGLAIGLAASLLLAGSVAGMTYEASTEDPVTLALVIAIIATSCLLSAWLPARRAAAYQPVEALRGD